MPPPRKVDLLPEELRQWLREALIERGFAGYEDLADDLNFRLEEEGLTLRIGKSALHAFGQDFQQYAEDERRAQEQARAFFKEANLADEVEITSALFQQLSTLLFRLNMTLSQKPDQIDAKSIKELSTALLNLTRSSELRDKLVQADRKAQAEKLDAAVTKGDIDGAAAAKAREIMGFAG